MADTTAKTAIGFSAEEANRQAHGIAEAVGFSQEETGRRSYELKDADGYQTYLPLQEWGMTRQDCVNKIDAEGLPQPGKSACVFCPMMKLCEVVALEPGQQAFAFAVEERADAGGKLKKVIGLRKGVNQKWSDWVENHTEEEANKTFVGLVSDLR